MHSLHFFYHTQNLRSGERKRSNSRIPTRPKKQTIESSSANRSNARARGKKKSEKILKKREEEQIAQLHQFGIDPVDFKRWRASLEKKGRINLKISELRAMYLRRQAYKKVLSSSVGNLFSKT